MHWALRQAAKEGRPGARLAKPFGRFDAPRAAKTTAGQWSSTTELQIHWKSPVLLVLHPSRDVVGTIWKTDSKQGEQQTLSATTWELSPSDLELYQYFQENGTVMFHFLPDRKSEESHEPVENVFLTIALSAKWCFDVVVLLFSAYHRRHFTSSHKAEDRQINTIQDRVLKAARERISAKVESRDSGDADILAFLFLAIVELRFGDKEAGLMHLEAWQRDLVMRRQYGVNACSTRCKIWVWWCISMLLGPNDPLPAVLDCKIVDRIRKDPARLLRCLAADGLDVEARM